MADMRLGVIDVGSNTVHLLVIDAHPGAQPTPDYSHKVQLQLAKHLTPQGAISQEGTDLLAGFIEECVEVAESRGVSQLMAFATSATRDASNTEDVLAAVRARSGVDLQVLDGPDEARSTFLAVRRWFGWSAGRILMIDIGGGSLELAAGLDEEPDVAYSLPLGAGRLTRTFSSERPDPQEIKEMRKHARTVIAEIQRSLAKVGEPQLTVGSSKTIRSLARACGAAPKGDGPYTPRTLSRKDLADLVPRLAEMDPGQRQQLPGVSAYRAPQLLAGAIVVESALELLGIETLAVCPWALREGLILRFLDGLPDD